MSSTLTSPSSQDTHHENEHLISDHDPEKDATSHLVPPPKWKSFTISGLFTLILGTALFSALISTLGLYLLHRVPFHSMPEAGEVFGSCGDTPSSARLANCTFDIMSFAWLPVACSDPELTTEFLSRKDWDWWLNNGTVTIPVEEVQSGDHEMLYVTREYHMYHCTYMWRKLHRGMLRDRVVDTYIGNYPHTGHCEKMLIGVEGEEFVDKHAADTGIVMKFPKCLRV